MRIWNGCEIGCAQDAGGLPMASARGTSAHPYLFFGAGGMRLLKDFPFEGRGQGAETDRPG